MFVSSTATCVACMNSLLDQANKEMLPVLKTQSLDHYIIKYDA
jgi:hypothetical protein